MSDSEDVGVGDGEDVDVSGTEAGDARDPARAEVGAEATHEETQAAGAPGEAEQGAAAEQASASDEDKQPAAAQQSGAEEAEPSEAADQPTPAAADPVEPIEVPEDSDAPLLVRRAPRIRTVDFSQPTKFTVELRRRMVRVLGPFCEAFALRLSSELRAPVELSVADSSQLTWAAAKAQLPSPAIGVALEVEPVEQRMLLGIEVSFVLRALECLLGGTAAQAPAERPLSEIDWALTKRLLESLVGQLSNAWRDLGDLQVTLGEVDLEGDAEVLAPIGEPTFAVRLAASIDGLPAGLSLLVPWRTIESIAEDVAGAGARAQDTDPRQGLAVQRGLAAAHVLLRAEVGSTQMPVADMLALRPGTALTLADRAEHGVQLFAEGVPLGRARPGLRGARRAVKLTAPLAPTPAPAMATTLAGAVNAPAGAGTHAQAKSTALANAGPPPDGASEETPADGAAEAAEHPAPDTLARMLGVQVRVWAELGRTTVPLRDALELPPGTVIELDQGAERPIELYVNGLCFAHGSLQVAREGEWAVRVDALV